MIIHTLLKTPSKSQVCLSHSYKNILRQSAGGSGRELNPGPHPDKPPDHEGEAPKGESYY
ncbi:hypothetical protein PGTUg99_034276 [Puccinia graminis f. sp. tritici]|uniref:Uncharacterized protein n=1 Tax=Puccinia graminis f. sp. tritici TaxID=56615 RepID=A0A5B0SM48_PUCGR|nr:hypothetical protein PGTUg99_034276 [Puccinia graminis f. sp. tritici]